MLVKIIRIYNGIVTCELDDGCILDIDSKWMPNNISVNEEIEIDILDR